MTIPHTTPPLLGAGGPANDAVTYFFDGVAHFQAGRIVEAAAAYDEAIRLRPTMFEAHNNLGIALQRLDKLDAALRCHDRAIALSASTADLHNSRGNCLILMQRPVDARASFLRCLELDPRHPLALNNEAIFLHRDNRHADALPLYEQAIAIAASNGVDFDDARYNRGLLLLTLGDFERGWPDYESRLPSLPPSPGDEVPLTSLDNLDTKLVYVRAEQGYGDTLQFVRYLPMLRQQGARVVFECQPGLKTLLDASDLCDDVVERGPSNGLLAAPAGAHSTFVQSLPYLFGTDFTNIPSTVPYLGASTARKEEWRRKFNVVCSPSGGGGRGEVAKRVGLVWSGNQSDLYNRHRSCVLADFAPLAFIKGIQFFSLQKGPGAVQALNPPPGMGLIHLGDDLLDFADTAAAMDQLDLIITIDTSMCHLAGALGRPVWTLLPWSADWRWFLGRVDSPWYPSMQLFRQRAPGDWPALFERVAAELAVWAS